MALRFVCSQPAVFSNELNEYDKYIRVYNFKILEETRKMYSYICRDTAAHMSAIRIIAVDSNGFCNWVSIRFVYCCASFDINIIVWLNAVLAVPFVRQLQTIGVRNKQTSVDSPIIILIMLFANTNIEFYYTTLNNVSASMDGLSQLEVISSALFLLNELILARPIYVSTKNTTHTLLTGGINVKILNEDIHIARRSLHHYIDMDLVC